MIPAIAHLFIDCNKPVTALDYLAATTFIKNGRMLLHVYVAGTPMGAWAEKLLKVAKAVTQLDKICEQVIRGCVSACGGVYIPRRMVCGTPIYKWLQNSQQWRSKFISSDDIQTIVFALSKGTTYTESDFITLSEYQNYLDESTFRLIWRANKLEKIPLMLCDDTAVESYNLDDLHRLREYQCTYTSTLLGTSDIATVDLTLVIPIKLDSQDRLENLLTLIDYAKTIYKVKDIVISEYDVVPRLASLVDGCGYCFTKADTTNSWNKSLAVNVGAKLVKTPYMAIWDSDVYLPLQSVLHAVQALETVDSCVPYSKFINLERAALNVFKYKQLCQTSLSGFKQLIAEMSDIETGQVYAAAAVVFINTSFFYHIRGMSELFYGYGWEDVEFAARLTKLGNCKILSGPMYHVIHSRTPTSTPDPLTRAKNVGECMYVRGLSADDLRKYLGITDQIGNLFNPSYLMHEYQYPEEYKDFSKVVNNEDAVLLNTTDYSRRSTLY